MTQRDRYIVGAVAVLGAIAAFWFLALAPKRAKLATLEKDVAEARQTLDGAQQEKVKFAQDQIAFPRLYASLGRLGKAVPPDQDVPSLLVQLNHAAAKANVNFHSVELKTSLAAKLEEAATASAGAAATTPPAGEGAQPAPPAGEGAQPAPPAGGEGAQPGTPAPAPGAAATASAGAAAPPAPGATAAPAAPVPAAGFKVLPFEYIFKGNFFELEKMVHYVTRLVERRNQELAITGRLISIRGFALKRSRITVLATTYMLPADQGLFAGATPQGPPGTDPAAPQAASSAPATPAPPTAAVTP